MMMDMNKRKIEPYRDTKPANSGRSLTCLGKSQMPVIGKLSGIGSEPSEFLGYKPKLTFNMIRSGKLFQQPLIGMLFANCVRRRFRLRFQFLSPVFRRTPVAMQKQHWLAKLPCIFATQPSVSC